MSDYYDQQETQAEEACLRTALRNGHTGEEAQFCEAGSVGCPDCPFEKRANTSMKTDEAPVL